ncbi:MAG: MaoC/PaaZ C-terminal domain-containing protein [Pseudomonadota bacterium]
MTAIRANRLTHLTTWDDHQVGSTVELGGLTVDPATSRGFDRAFVGPRDGAESEASTMFLSVSLMRLIVESYLAHAEGLGAPGVDALLRLRPAQLGGELQARMTCLAKRPLGSRPEVGLADIMFDVTRDDGERVLSWRNKQFMRIRDPESAQASAEAPGVAKLQVNAHDEPAPTIQLGQHTFTRQQILAFAGAYDPQPFHLDDRAASKSLFGALCASGWHTCAVWTRLFRDYMIRNREMSPYPTQVSPLPDFDRLQDLKWIRPVFVDDVISFSMREIGTSTPENGSTARVFEALGIDASDRPVFQVTAVQRDADIT